MKSISLGIKNFVLVKEEGDYQTWVLADARSIKGWQWDKRLLTDNSRIGSCVENFVGGFSQGLKDGFNQNDFVSGTIKDLAFSTLLDKQILDSTLWIPQYDVGQFSVFSDKRILYSDYSFSTSLDSGIHPLHVDCKENTITCSIFRRDNSGLIYLDKSFKYVEKFTDEDGEPTDEIAIEKTNARKNEFTIRDNTLYCNRNYIKSIGIGNSLEDIKDTWEAYTPEAGGYIYLSYTNVKDVEVCLIDESNNIRALNRVESLDYIDENNFAFVADEQMGVLQVSGLEADSTILFESVSEENITLNCYRDENFINLPERGIVKINNEYIAYTSKNYSSLSNCIRGYLGSMPSPHLNGTQIQFVKRGAYFSGAYYVKYKAVPRVEYEVTTSRKRTASGEKWLSVYNLANSKTNKIVQLYSSTLNVASLELSTDAPLLGGNLYGPIYFGTDVGRLIAIAYDSVGNPVEDINITIEIISGAGLLDSRETSVTKESNTDGQIYASFNAPYDASTTFLAVEAVSYTDTDTILSVPSLSLNVMPNEVTLFQTLKHDPTLGTVGKRIKSVTAGTASLPYGAAYVDCLMEYTEEYDGGIMQILFEDVRYTANIRKAFKISDSAELYLTRFYLEEDLGIFADPFEATIWLYQEEAIGWDSELLNGIDVLVYEYSQKYKHPITGEIGAYGPLLPDSIKKTNLYFKNRLLPEPKPTDDSNNLGAYKIVSSSEVKFQAFCTDPYSGKTIESNIIRFKLTLPSTLTGVDYTKVLPIPHGLILASEDFNISSGIGGANFITVNPQATGLGQISIRGSF